MNGEDVVNVAGAIIYWWQNWIITVVDFIATHGWYVAAGGVGVIVVSSAALLIKRRRANAHAQRTPAENRERTP